jgi:hypothetical protein
MSRPSHSSRFDHPNYTGRVVQIKKLFLCILFHPPVTSSLLRPNIMAEEASINLYRTVRPIYRTGVPLPSRCCILYIFFSTNTSTEYFKHAAHSPFFSSKCCLFHNATVFWFLCYSHFTYRVC